MKMKKYNLSKIMKRAWTLVKKESMDISSALKKSWREEKEMKENNLIETLKANLEDMAYSDHNINAGIDRQVSEKKWENGENKRTYLSINCYTAVADLKELINVVMLMRLQDRMCAVNMTMLTHLQKSISADNYCIPPRRLRGQKGTNKK